MEHGKLKRIIISLTMIDETSPGTQVTCPLQSLEASGFSPFTPPLDHFYITERKTMQHPHFFVFFSLNDERVQPPTEDISRSYVVIRSARMAASDVLVFSQLGTCQEGK